MPLWPLIQNSHLMTTSGAWRNWNWESVDELEGWFTFTFSWLISSSSIRVHCWKFACISANCFYKRCSSSSHYSFLSVPVGSPCLNCLAVAISYRANVSATSSSSLSTVLSTDSFNAQINVCLLVAWVTTLAWIHAAFSCSKVSWHDSFVSSSCSRSKSILCLKLCFFRRPFAPRQVPVRAQIFVEHLNEGDLQQCVRSQRVFFFVYSQLEQQQNTSPSLLLPHATQQPRFWLHTVKSGVMLPSIGNAV